MTAIFSTVNFKRNRLSSFCAAAMIVASVWGSVASSLLAQSAAKKGQAVVAPIAGRTTVLSVPANGSKKPELPKSDFDRKVLQLFNENELLKPEQYPVLRKLVSAEIRIRL